MARFDARFLARGWLSVAIAASRDKDRPALCRTVAIERYAHGVRLVATDSYLLLRSWVPELEYEDEPEPEIDEMPIVTSVAMDPHGRAKGFMGHVLKLAAGEDAELVEVEMGLGVVQAKTDAPEMEGLESHWVTLDHPGHERLRLLTYDGDFPSWRKAVWGFQRASTSVVALNPEIVERLAKVGKLNGGAPLVWHFGGESRMARIEVAHSQPIVEGLLMPVRWDFDGDQPQSVTDEATAGAAAPTTEDEPRAEPATAPEPEVEVDLEDAAMRVVVTSRRGSESLLMEKLGVGATTAARLIDLLEVTGVVGPPKGAAPRDVLMPVEELEELDRLKAADAAGRIVETVAVDV